MKIDLASFRAWAKCLKRDVVALWIAAQGPRVPWHVKLVSGAVDVIQASSQSTYLPKW